VVLVAFKRRDTESEHGETKTTLSGLTPRSAIKRQTHLNKPGGLRPEHSSLKFQCAVVGLTDSGQLLANFKRSASARSSVSAMCASSLRPESLSRRAAASTYDRPAEVTVCEDWGPFRMTVACCSM
jgi:hypothetical protein